MGFYRGPKIVTDGLKLYLDAANPKSYSGIGTTVTDLSGNNKNGNLYNGAAFSLDNSIALDGVNDYIAISDPALNQYDWTIDIVVKCNNFSNSPIFLSPVSAGIDHFLRFSNSGQIVFQVTTAADVGNRNSNSNYIATAGETLYITVVRTAGYRSTYINGQLDTQTADTTESANWNGGWILGARGNVTYNLNGNIYLVKAYNRVLSDEEILQNYNALKSRFNL